MPNKIETHNVTGQAILNPDTAKPERDLDQHPTDLPASSHFVYHFLKSRRPSKGDGNPKGGDSVGCTFWAHLIIISITLEMTYRRTASFPFSLVTLPASISFHWYVLLCSAPIIQVGFPCAFKCSLTARIYRWHNVQGAFEIPSVVADCSISAKAVTNKTSTWQTNSVLLQYFS